MKIDHFVPPSVVLQAQLLLIALQQGFSPEVDLQQRALNFFANDLLIRVYPPVRVVVNAIDLPRLCDGLATHPLQFALQVFLFGTNAMFEAAGKRPPGPAAQKAPIAGVAKFLACLADEVISRDQKVFQRIRVLAQQAGYGVDAATVNRLEAIYFLVARAMKKIWRLDLEAVQPYDRDFARTYLYPYRKHYRAPVARCLQISGVWQRLLALDENVPPSEA